MIQETDNLQSGDDREHTETVKNKQPEYSVKSNTKDTTTDTIVDNVDNNEDNDDNKESNTDYVAPINHITNDNQEKQTEINKKEINDEDQKSYEDTVELVETKPVINEEKKQQIVIDKKYALPTSLGGIPIESTIKLTSEDKEMMKRVEDKYADKLAKHPLERMKLMHRYVTGYRHMKKKKRFTEMCKDIDYFFEMHEKYDCDNIINTESNDEEHDAWKQFLYGEDEYGHPIMYDLIGSSDCKKMKKVFMDESQPFGDAAFKHIFRFMRFVFYLSLFQLIILLCTQSGYLLVVIVAMFVFGGFDTEKWKITRHKIRKNMVN